MNRAIKNSSGNIVINDAEIDLQGLGDISVGITQVEIVVTEVSRYFRIKADETNTGIIFIGKTGVLADKTNDFIRLNPGDEFAFEYNDINALYAISDTASQLINVGVVVTI